MINKQPLLSASSIGEVFSIVLKLTGVTTIITLLRIKKLVSDLNHP
jgi:hypothetical protein